MAQYTDNSNIIYNNVSKGKGIAKISHSNTDFEDEIVGKVVNAVEIDWNGASICNQTVNTTGQLLSN